MNIPGLDQISPTIGAGLAGALTGALTMNGTIWERVIAGVAGALSAVFMGPVATPIVAAGIELIDRQFLNDAVHIDVIHIASFTGFVLGVTGMMIVGGLQSISRAGARRATEIVDPDNDKPSNPNK